MCCCLRSEEFAWKVGAQYARQESTGSRNSWDPVSGAGKWGKGDPEGGGRGRASALMSLYCGD